MSFVFCLLSFSGISEGSNLIRVAVKTSPYLEIEVKRGTSVTDTADNRTFTAKGSLQLTVKPGNSGIDIDNKKFGDTVKIKPSKGSLLSIDKTGYRGSIEILKNDKGELLVINELDVEDYLKGVVNEEISAKWHPESLKAQAVVARTYALYQKEKRKDNPYHMEATTMDQVYGGMRNEDEQTNKAVDDTRGIVLTYGGKLAKAFYHSISGGITEDASAVWGGERETYLKAVKCYFDKDAPNYQWEAGMDTADIEMALSKNGVSADGILTIETASFTPSGRVSELLIKHGNGLGRVSGVNFRKFIGYDVIRSTLFRVKKNGNNFIFYGRGSGHGVGLCQWGAKGMAEKKYSYTDILKYYYPGIEIKRIK